MTTVTDSTARAVTGHGEGVTEGDITPRAMKTATFATLALACAVGCSLIYWGGWWMLPAGILIALGVMAYSTAPTRCRVTDGAKWR